MKLLENLVKIHSPSGEEFRMKKFILNYIEHNQSNWLVKPEIFHGNNFHDSVVLIFGDPTTAILAHIDTIGFTVRYNNQLIPIGSPVVSSGFELTGQDSLGLIDCVLKVDKENQLYYDFPRAINRGTSLVFKPNFRLTDEYVQTPYLDNRLGVYNALRIAETLKNGAIVFSTYEEHFGGSIPFLIKFLCENFNIKQALISDITWVTEGVRHGEGVAISLRDRNIPRKQFLDRIMDLANHSGVSYQIEVEGSGSSDGREVQISPYPLDWCFIGAPEDHVHSPDEKVYLTDIQAMIEMYTYLMEHL